MHGLVTLLGIEAALIGALHLVTRGSWYRTCAYLLAVTAPLEVYRTTISDVNASLFRISIAVVLTTVVVDRVRARSRGRPAKPLPPTAWLFAGAYLLLALVVAASLLDVGDSFHGRRQLAVLIVGALVVVLAAELAARTSPRDLGTAVVVSAVLPVLAGGWQLLAPRLHADVALPLLEHLPVGPGLEGSQTESSYLNPLVSTAVRVNGTMLDPNHFGIYLVFVLFVAGALAVDAARRRERGRALALTGMASTTAAALIATYSRSAWLAAVVALVTCAMLLGPAIRRLLAPRRLALAAAAAASIAALALAAAGPTLGARLSPSSALNTGSNSGHLDNPAVGVRMFRSRPLLGIGAGRLSIVLSAKNPRAAGADSTYVTVAAELGAVGLFVLALAAGIVIQLLWLARHRTGERVPALLPVALLGAYFGFIVANAFHDEWFRDFHFVLLGFVAAASAPGRAATEGA